MHRLQPCSGTLVGWPRSFGIERYQEAATSYAVWLAQDPGVFSVYQVGDIGVPGLSDIDLVVVLDPNRVQGKECRFRIDFLPKDLQYLFMHDAVFLSESLFSHLSLNQKVGTCTGEGVITLWNSFAPKGCSALAANHGGLSPFQFSQLQMYAKGRGPLSHYLRSCLTGNVFIEWLDQSYQHMVQQRAMLLNEYHHFLNSCGIQLGRVFGFGYQERGVPLRIQRMIARLRYKVFGPFEIPGWREAS